tara:strand:- start:1748 stop:1921 length:174 start_codon:yes stop_codon:yes gene_type:complete
MIDRETFNKYKKILKIKGEFPYNDKNVNELMYKFYKYENEFGSSDFQTKQGRGKEIY